MNNARPTQRSHHPRRGRPLPTPHIAPRHLLLILFGVGLVVLIAVSLWRQLAQTPGLAPKPAGGNNNHAFLPLVMNSRRPAATQAPINTPTGATNTYYVDGQLGNDANAGASNAPWRTVTKAISTIPTGATVVIAAGIYRVSELTFGPAGLSASQHTIFRAAPAARVIFSTADDLPPMIYMSDYVRLEGLWFGGHYQNGSETTWGGFRPGGGPIGVGRQIVNCTLFGYREGIQIGSSENMLVQGNRLVSTGHGELMHGIYLSGGYTAGSMSQHIIVDNNLFVGGEGWGIHGWHLIHSVIVTRNFVTQHNYGSVLDGSDHLVANNFFWQQHGGDYSAKGYWLAGQLIRFYNNLLGPNSPISPDSNLTQNTLLTNAFLGPNTNVPALGTSAVVLTAGQEQAQLGVSAATLDATISALQQAFAQPIATLYADTTLEGLFSTLRLTVPAGSPLRGTGTPWYGTSTNIGPDAPAPADEAGFWAAFHALGLRDWDRNGNVTP